MKIYHILVSNKKANPMKPKANLVTRLLVTFGSNMYIRND